MGQWLPFSRMAGPIFYIKHIKSAKYIHPESGSSPQNRTALVVNSGALGEKRIQFRFIPVEGEKKFGYLENVETGRIVHPLSPTETPPNETPLVFHSARMRKALFAYDSLNDAIMHISGKYVQPLDGASYPGDGIAVQLRDGLQPGSHFKFVNESGQEINPYPMPELSGEWIMVNSVINPVALHTSTYSFTTGRSQTKKSTSQDAWGISANLSAVMFSASAEYSGFARNTTEETWSEEKTVERNITVKPGQSVVTWQFVFGATQYGDSLQFKSNILTDTDDMENRPKLPALEDHKQTVCDTHLYNNSRVCPEAAAADVCLSHPLI